MIINISVYYTVIYMIVFIIPVIFNFYLIIPVVHSIVVGIVDLKYPISVTVY